jgi:hypothetical protein
MFATANPSNGGFDVCFAIFDVSMHSRSNVKMKSQYERMMRGKARFRVVLDVSAKS